jgi:hypothetical protein
MVRQRLAGNADVEEEIEVLVAKSFGLDREGFSVIMQLFSKLTDHERMKLLDSPLWEIRQA